MPASSPILVTGAAGFIGARFVASANQRNRPIVSVDKLSHFADRAEHRELNFGTQIDREGVFDWLRNERPELSGIVHLGACTDTTELDVLYLERWNVEFSRRLWDYAVERRVPFVYASSAATYGDGSLGYSDDEALFSRLKPLNPYGESKLKFDLQALAEERVGKHPPSWCGFKFFNVYGFGERHKEQMASVVLHAFDQIRNEGKVRLFKSYRPSVAHGMQMRDFIYVEDVVRVLWFALEKPVARGVFNLGTGTARSYLDLARAVFAGLGRAENIEFVDMPSGIAERYQYFTQAEMTRLRHEGYTSPFTSLEDGVAEYVGRLKRS